MALFGGEEERGLEVIGGGFRGNFPSKPNSRKGKIGVVSGQGIKSPPAFTEGPRRIKRRDGSSIPGSIVPELAFSPPPSIKPAPDNRPSVVAVVGRFSAWPWGQYPDESYFATAFEKLGVRVIKVDQDGPRKIVDSDWVIFTGQPKSWEQLPEWAPNHQTILWTLDWLPSYSERRPIIEMGRNATLFVTSDRHDWAGVYGIRNHFYLPAACEGVVPNFTPRPVRSCAFLGTLYNERRRNIASIVEKAGGVVLQKPGEWLYGLALAKFVQETKVVIGDNVTNDVPGYWSSRNYVIPGAGGFLLTAKVPGLYQDLIPGEHIGVYPSLERLPEALAYSIGEDQVREEIRRKGFLHVRKKHSWAERALALGQKMGLQIRK